ncbi:hypothetical protein ACHQM5_015650 [Ranunculus cassubicifolius]
MKRECALCTDPAKVYCESDESSLCWKCDWKIHSANFLVAKHCRCLLCHFCQSLTQWKASGEKIGSTLSVCQNCVLTQHKHRLHTNQNLDESEGDSVNDQVVPWMSSSASVSSSTSDQQSSAEFTKRIRDEDVEIDSNKDDLCCSSSSSQENTDETSLESLRPLKIRKLEDSSVLSGLKDSEESNVLVEELKRFHRELIATSSLEGGNKVSR